ncbi:TPA: hypothetical protein ACOIVO_002014, partial [Pasteurella multocida]
FWWIKIELIHSFTLLIALSERTLSLPTKWRHFQREPSFSALVENERYGLFCFKSLCKNVEKSHDALQ